MKLTQKQKRKLISDMDRIASSATVPPKLKKKAKKMSPYTTSQQPLGAKRGAGGSIVNPPSRGISNVRGQRTDIPLTQTFAGSESLGRFNGSVNFTETQFAINPGQAGTFPWLSKEAQLWEKYEFDKLDFEFRTTINEFSANAFGRVILGVDFDAADPPPATRSEAEVSRPVTAQAPYFNQLLSLRKVDMSDTVKKHYVRPGNLPGSSDIKMYDVGNLNFGTDGNINANEVGELWVHYSGKFYNQVLESTTTPPLNNSVAQFQTAALVPVTATPVNIPLATVSTNGINAVNTAGSIVLPLGNYLFDYTVAVTAATSLTNFQVSLDKNAGVVGIAQQWLLAGAAVCQAASISGSYYGTSNGTDAYTLVLVETGTGALAASGQLRITAV